MSETSDLTRAVKELTQELKRQRGADPDASLADTPKRLVEPVTETSPTVYGRIMANSPHGGVRLEDCSTFQLADYLGVPRSRVLTETGENID